MQQMFSYNKVIIGGLACNTPSLRENGGGTHVTNFTIKTIETWKDRQTGKIKTYSKYHRIVAWGKTAERAVKVVKKDSIIMVEGKLNYHNHNKDGDVRNIAEIKAYVIEKKGEYRPQRKPFPKKRPVMAPRPTSFPPTRVQNNEAAV